MNCDYICGLKNKNLLTLKKLYCALLLFFPFYIIAADYYWIGGSGNWSDISHWATASGGSVTHSQAPTSDDDVFFDANSFTGPNQTVTLNTDIAFVHNMDWSTVTNNPTFSVPRTGVMNVFGDYILSAIMTYNFLGTIRFQGDTPNNTIQFSGHDVGYVAIFNGNGGWMLTDDFTVDSVLVFERGNLNVNGQNVETRHLYLTTNNSKTLDLTNSNILVTGAFIDTYRDDSEDVKSSLINTNNLTIIPTGSTIEFSAKDPALWYIGDENIDLGNILFTSNTGKAILRYSYDGVPAVSMEALSFSASATIWGDLSINALNLAGGHVYEFESDRTFDLGNINGNGDCAGGVIITSIDNGVPTTFAVSSGAIDLVYVTLRDIHTAGGASFTASNGTDLGNNTGWSFTNSNSVDFYWVGGTGNWSDPVHWSFTSGGPSSGCVPSGKDNVFFDANSFSANGQIVTVDKENIYMHDMTWNGVTNNPEFTGDLDYRIRVTGSLELSQDMQHTFEGYYHFESNEPGNIITMNGQMFNREIYFSGIMGEWILQDDMEIQWNLNLLSGTLRTNGQTVTMLRFMSETEQYRRLDIMDSRIVLRAFDYHSPYWTVTRYDYHVLAARSTIEINGYYTSFGHYDRDPNIENLQYDKVIFNAYFGDVNSYNWLQNADIASLSIDSLIFNFRGTINGSHNINYLQLATGYDYGFSSYNSETIQDIGELVVSGDCAEGLTKLFASEPGTGARINLDQTYDFERLDIRDINITGSGSINANNSVDGGNNTNIMFTELTSRTLYWVGDGGDWQDVTHWSLSSGGPGGECIPTAIDDVIFDQNSFTMPNQNVESQNNRFRYCRNITWTNTQFQPRFGSDFLLVHGSLEYDQSFTNDVWQTQFVSNEAENVYANGQRFNLIIIRGEGSISFEDDVEAYELNHQAGEFILNDITIDLDQLIYNYSSPKSSLFRNSTINIHGTGDINYPPFRDYTYRQGNVIDAGTSTINLTNTYTGIYSENNITLNNVNFSNPNGQGYVSTYYSLNDNFDNNRMTLNELFFAGNGEVNAILEANSFIGSPGKTYILDGGETHQINEYLQLIGNNCTPIELRSSVPSMKSTIDMPSSGEIVVDFVQMENQIGTGGADFNAGSRSVDVGISNQGWIFEDTPDYIETGFLGEDRALCNNDDLVLNAYSFSPNEMYTWSDGSTDSILTVTNPGTYFVEVQFQSNCILRDTVEILAPEDVMPNLDESIDLCEGMTAALDAEIPSQFAVYNWNTGEDTPLINVTEGGSYIVEIELNGCVTEDTTVVNLIENPGLDLGGDRSVCEGEAFTLGTSVMANAYLWQDGSTDAELTSTLDGLYWLEIDYQNCSFRDSVTIAYTMRPVPNIGNDTIKCSNEELILSVQNSSGLMVEWQDGSTANTLEVTSEGPYVVTLDDNGCVGKDSIYVTVVDAPVFDLGDDINECEGEEIVINAPTGFSDFTWDDGSSEVQRTVVTTGTYVLTVTENGCSEEDSVRVNFQTLPVVELGMDTVVCDDEPYILMPVFQSSGVLTWGDGSRGNSFVVDRPGEVMATITEGNCSSADGIRIDFKECINFEIYVPNAFSPNEDGFNDVLEINFSDGLVIQSFELAVFDKWGNKVFGSRDVNDYWDGRYNSRLLETGVYVYYINVSYIDDFGEGEQVIKGDVTILK